MLEGVDLAGGYDGRAVFRGVSLRLAPGQILGLEGPSGQGKTTLGRLLAGLQPPLQGAVLLDAAPLPRRGACPVQYLPQHPLGSMNPRWRIRRILAEAAPPGPQDLAAVGVDPAWLERFPHELSGGQLHRVSLLRALLVRPRYLIADEITASLDQLSQAEIWRVLQDLARDRGIGILAISHDTALLRAVCTEVRGLEG